MKFSGKFLDEKARIIVLVRGELEEGGPYYAYLALMPSKADAYEKAMASGKVVSLSEFGKVIEWGKGENPPEDVVQRMEELGFNHRFEEELQAIVAESKKQNPES